MEIIPNIIISSWIQMYYINNINFNMITKKRRKHRKGKREKKNNKERDKDKKNEKISEEGIR